MPGDGKVDNNAAADPKKAAFNPLWLVDAGAGLGLLLFIAGWALVGWRPWLGLLREVGLLLVGCWVVVRALEVILRHRDGRDEQRRELLRRLAVLNDALLELRKSLSRDNIRRFHDRREAYGAGLKLARPSLSPEEAELAKGCRAFCDRVEGSLTHTIHNRAELNTAVERLRREIERAARRGDLDQHDADDLIDIIADAVSVLDEALYAEWNADHVGRLTADQRHFARELDRYKSSAAGEIERRGRDLFGQLFGHVRQKVEVVDLLHEWAELYRKLETRLAGLYVAPPKSSAPKDKDKKDEKPKPRPSERFPQLVLSDEDEDEDFGRRRGVRHRLPAAND